MKIEFKEIETAYMKANSAGYGEKMALLDKESGTFYYQSDYSAGQKLPDELQGAEHIVSLPDKKGLNLGSQFVFNFIRDAFPAGYDEVSEIFTRRGAYGRYKKWLVANELLDQWNAYEAAAEEAALRKWCADNGVELEG